MFEMMQKMMNEMMGGQEMQPMMEQMMNMKNDNNDQFPFSMMSMCMNMMGNQTSAETKEENSES